MLTVASRGLLLRDRMNGDLARLLNAFPYKAERFFLKSGTRELAAIYVSAGPTAPAFVLCHGIGERIEYWAGVQGLLQRSGVSSLVFNYTGFGASAGRIATSSCEEDAIAAVGDVIERGARDIFLLGFSLGTAVASAIAPQVNVDGVILCEGFSSLEEAAQIAGIPKWLTRLADGVWQTEQHVIQIEPPVLVVHSEDDGLFPVSMARKITQACGECGQEIIFSGFRHNEPIFTAPEEYWGPIVAWAKQRVEMKQRA